MTVWKRPDSKHRNEWLPGARAQGWGGQVGINCRGAQSTFRRGLEISHILFVVVKLAYASVKTHPTTYFKGGGVTA